MTKKTRTWILALAAVGLVIAGCARLRLDVDVFNLLPTDSRTVDGLRLYQQSFASPRGLVLSLRAADAETAEQAARSLAEELERVELTPHAVWQSPFREDPEAAAELIAYLWLNQPAADFESVAARFHDEQLKTTLEVTFERLATSLSAAEVARLGQDPFALTDLVDRVAGTLGTEDPFASADGSFRILFARPPMAEAGFWENREWTARLREHVSAWQRERGDASTLTVRLTGNPAFVAETGRGLLHDMQAAAVGTLVLVAGLFWLAHRRWAPLVWLVVLLVAVLAATAALGGLLMGKTISAMSLGFAAILLGLAADYALILYQELMSHPERPFAELRRAVAPSILWAAVTTAGAFFMIGRSSLPGLTELGTLVAIGTLVAAGVMLLVFLPPLARRSGSPVPLAPAGGVVFPSPRTAAWITAVGAVGALAVLAQKLPAIDQDTKQLGPREGRARAALEEVRREIGGFDEASLWLLVEGADENAVAGRLDRARALLGNAVEEGLLAGYSMPDGLWPRPGLQAANRAAARRLTERLPAARRAALEAGFTPDALRLTEGIFTAWEELADGADGVVWPERPGSQWIFRQFASRQERQFLALGWLEASEGADLAHLAERIEVEAGGRLFGWSPLADSLLGTMERDVKKVLLPMGAVLLLLLGLAFRRPREVVLSLLTLGLSLVCLLGVMALAGWSWNLMNIMALPLLFGAGVDYSIHIQLALQRHSGDVARVRQTVGRAILLCGASTAAGFGTLAFASNAGLASLGRVCAAGIVLSSLTAVLLLPAWWRAVERIADRRKPV